MALSGLALTSASPPATLDLELSGLRSSKGVVQLCLTRDSARFPDCGPTAFRTVPAGQGHVRIDGLPSGAYAIALFHDENRNGRLDTVLGIPREGFGFSRNPPIGFGPPKWGAARFTLMPGQTDQQVRLKYLL